MVYVVDGHGDAVGVLGGDAMRDDGHVLGRRSGGYGVRSRQQKNKHVIITGIHELFILF